MTKKENQIYKSGRKNPNGYFKNPFDIFGRKKYFAIFISLLIVVSLVFEVICISGLTSWNKLFSFFGIVDSLQKDSDFTIYYLDVGQGDCSIVICDDEILMIDTSTSNQFYNIRTNLFMLEIDKIDYLIATHPHDDHIGSAIEIINHYEVSNIMMPKISITNQESSLMYDNLIKAIVDNDVTPNAVSYGDSFMLGSAKVEILSPTKQDDNINNMSVVFKITYKNTSFLFTGDSEKEIEKQLLRNNVDISADVLKISHHGSDSSTTKDFLSTVNPDYAIISSGKDNTYGHPSKGVIERLEEIGIIPYITSMNGNITVTSDGDKVTVVSEK